MFKRNNILGGIYKKGELPVNNNRTIIKYSSQRKPFMVLVNSEKQILSYGITSLTYINDNPNLSVSQVWLNLYNPTHQ